MDRFKELPERSQMTFLCHGPKAWQHGLSPIRLVSGSPVGSIGVRLSVSQTGRGRVIGPGVLNKEKTHWSNGFWFGVQKANDNAAWRGGSERHSSHHERCARDYCGAQKKRHTSPQVLPEFGDKV